MMKEIIISREEIEHILKEKFLIEPCGYINGEIEFIIKESNFDGIKIIINDEK